MKKFGSLFWYVNNNNDDNQFNETTLQYELNYMVLHGKKNKL